MNKLSTTTLCPCSSSVTPRAALAAFARINLYPPHHHLNLFLSSPLARMARIPTRLHEHFSYRMRSLHSSAKEMSKEAQGGLRVCGSRRSARGLGARPSVRHYLRPSRLRCNVCVCVCVCVVVWCGVVWCGVVWCGVVWRGVVWCGVVWCMAYVRPRNGTSGEGTKTKFQKSKALP